MIEDLSQFFSDFGIPMTFGSITKNVLYELQSKSLFDGYMQGQSRRITYNPTDFPGLAKGSSVKWKGRDWRIENPIPSEDGALWLADLVLV